MSTLKLGQIVIYHKTKDRPLAAIVVRATAADTVNLVVFTEHGSVQSLQEIPVGDLEAVETTGGTHAAEEGTVKEGSGAEHSRA